MWTKKKRKILLQKGVVKGEQQEFISPDNILQKSNGVYLLEVSTRGSKNLGHHLVVLNCFNSYIYDGGKLVYVFRPSEAKSEAGRKKILSDTEISAIFKVWLICDETYSTKSSFDDRFSEFYYEISGSKEYTGHPIFKESI